MTRWAPTDEELRIISRALEQRASAMREAMTEARRGPTPIPGDARHKAYLAARRELWAAEALLEKVALLEPTAELTRSAPAEAKTEFEQDVEYAKRIGVHISEEASKAFADAMLRKEPSR